jgi:hypothetical protein
LDDLVHPLTADLTVGRVDATECVDRRDPDDERRQARARESGGRV